MVYGLPQKVVSALQNGADANERDKPGDLPLLLGVFFNGNANIIELLLAAGACPRRTDVHGLSALHWLAQRGDSAADLAPLADALIAAGADLTAREDLYGTMHLTCPLQHGDLAPRPTLGIKHAYALRRLPPQGLRHLHGQGGMAMRAPRRFF